jgi:acetyltransferase
MPSRPPSNERIGAAALPARRDAPVDLLIDAVEDSSSVGFLLPLPRSEAEQYRDGLTPSLAARNRLLWLASDSTDPLGTVQLEQVTKKSGVNRAEVQKLLAHTRDRRAGIGRLLMQRVEASARELRRGLLLLDTETDSGVEQPDSALGDTCIGGLPENACSPRGAWRANAIYCKTLFLRGVGA